jgi:DNA-binding NarL/FixJ family response regulator
MVLPPQVATWVDGFIGRVPPGRQVPPAEIFFPSEADRRLRLRLETLAVSGMNQFVLRSLPALAWMEPGVRRLQARYDLTLREAEVAVAAARGLSNREVAERFGIVEKTVKNVLMSVFRKMHVRYRVEMALRACDIPIPPASTPI